MMLHGLAGDYTQLHARVRAQQEEIKPPKKAPLSCLVIDYEGDDVKLTTWVARKTGLVMRQDAKLEGTHWVMKRE